MMRRFGERYKLYFVLLLAILLTACTPIRPAELIAVATPPPPASAVIDGFQWQIDGAYGYRMLRPASWQPINLGDARGYYPPGSTGEIDRLLLAARNLLALDLALNSVPLTLFRDQPTIAAWTAALEESWQRGMTSVKSYTLEATLPNARIYALQSPIPDQMQVVAYIVADDQPLVISLDTFGRYANVQRLRDEGLFADLVTMVASATVVELDPQKIEPPLVEDSTAANTNHSSRPTPTIITAATADQEASPPFSFPQAQTKVTSDTVRSFNTALLEGELALINNCVAMLDTARQPVMVIWPPEYLMNENNGRIQLFHQRSGQLLAQLGDKIALGGGYATVEIAQGVAGSTLPRECTPAVTGVDAFFLAAPMLQVKEAFKRTLPAPETVAAGEPNQSPDGQWRAVVRTNLQADNTMRWFYVALQVTSHDGQTTWTPIAEERAFGLGYSLPAVVQWSNDGQALYYTEAYRPDGCVIFGGGSGLRRLDLASGKVMELLSASWDLAISPDETTVAYTGAVLDELSLRNLATKETHGIKLPMLEAGAQVGSIVWSPDSQRLAFTVAYEPCLPPEWSQSIVVADVRTRTVKTLIEKDKRLFVAQAWLDADRIQVSDQEGKTWEVDVATGTLATGEDGLFQMERTQIIKPPFESTCPVSQPDANFWSGTGPVAGFFPVWVTTYGEEDWSMLWRDVLPPGGVKLGFERGKLSGKRLVFIDQSIQGDLQITGKEWQGNDLVYFPSREILTTLDEQTDQLTETPPTVREIPDATTLDRTPNPPGKATRGWGFLVPHPGCYEFTFAIAEHKIPIIMEFVEPAVLAQRQAARAVAIAQIRAFANDPQLQVNFVGVSTSSYAPVTTYLFTTTVGMYEVNANTNEIVHFGPRSLGPGETPPTYDLTPRYTPDELEAMAKKLIATYSPTIDLTQLTPQHGNKEGTAFFFQWEDTAHRVEWVHPFVQVGLTRGGDLISYSNTVTMSKAFIQQ